MARNHGERELDVVSTEDNVEPGSGRKITFDNIDYHQNVHYMSEEHQNIDKHYVTYMSTENRVSGNNLSQQLPPGGVMEMDNGKCLPSTTDNVRQRLNYINLVEQVITTNIPCLKFLSDVCTKHIPHKYGAEMKNRSETVFLGMIYENENDADGIITILQKLHKFMPCDEHNEELVYGNQGVVGDQLTVERAINGHMSLSNGFTAKERVEGLHFEVADWHAGNKFLEIAFNNLYSVSSAADKCTMFSDRNLINRRNVKSDVTAAANACRRFFTIEVESRIVGGALSLLELTSLDEEKVIFPNTEMASKEEKKKFLRITATLVVDKFVIDQQRMTRYWKLFK